MNPSSDPSSATTPSSRTWTTAESPNKPHVDDVSAPSLSTSKALARFEFESDRGNDGTKILMVEWEDDDTTKRIKGAWHVSWKNDDKERAVLPVDDQKSNDMHRLYFLIPPGSSVPPSLKLKFVPADDATGAEVVEWKTTPLPAIFPPELGSFAREKGKKGVLHTIWAKKRLSVLQNEIDTEMKNNLEGIGLEMALAEKEWIETNFGVTPKPQRGSLSIAVGDAQSQGLRSPSISSPRSPGGGRLLEKMKGMKLETRDESGPKPEVPSFANPLSPEESDMAMSSFASIKGTSEGTIGKVGGSAPQSSFTRKIAPQGPPSEILAQQDGGSGMASLSGVAYAEVSFARPTDSTANPPDVDEDDFDEEDLFALPLNHRSSDSTAPFSIAAKNVE